jgi:hypothetical protein
MHPIGTLRLSYQPVLVASRVACVFSSEGNVINNLSLFPCRSMIPESRCEPLYGVTPCNIIQLEGPVQKQKRACEGHDGTPERVTPFSPISVASPLGRVARSCSRAQAATTRLNRASSYGECIRMFSFTVAFCIQESCTTIKIEVHAMRRCASIVLS